MPVESSIVSADTEKGQLNMNSKEGKLEQIQNGTGDIAAAITTAPSTQDPNIQPQKPASPSRKKKLVDKFATFSPGRTKNKMPDRQLILETAYCNRNGNSNTKKDPQQSDLRAVKSPETLPRPKKKKRPINITEGMSRADIFAANVASAVDAAEADLDEDEDFIYRDGGHTRTSSLTSLNATPPPSANLVHPYMQFENGYGYPTPHYQLFSNLYDSSIQTPKRSSFHNASRSPLYPPNNQGHYNNNSEIDEASNLNIKKTSSSPELLQSHKPTGVMRASLPDMSQYTNSKGYSNSNYGSPRYYHNDPFYHDWYGVDDERLPLFAKWRRPPFEDRRRSYCTSAIFPLFAFLLFSIVAFCYLVYFASSQPLLEVSITDISNVLVADKEIMFDIHVKASNVGIFDIEIVDTDLKVFATPLRNSPSTPEDDVDNRNTNDIAASQGHFNSTHARGTSKRTSTIQKSTLPNSPVDPAPSEYLGRVFSLDNRLVFPDRASVVATAQITLKNPGGKDAQGKWPYLLRQGFDLTVRGILRYTLPFSKDQVVRVCYIKRVAGMSSNTPEDFLTGSCSEDWDESDDYL